jgi:hypothetical protein
MNSITLLVYKAAEGSLEVRGRRFRTWLYAYMCFFKQMTCYKVAGINGIRLLVATP